MFTENLDVFYSDFRREAVCSLTGGGTRSIWVLFDLKNLDQVDGLGDIRPGDLDYTARAQTADLANVDAGNQIVVGGYTCKLIRRIPTAHGETFLILKKLNS